MSKSQLQVVYRDADLKVEFSPEPSVRLLINDISRQEETADEVPCTLRLSSTVQTDYEWHEFIEAIIRYDEETVSIQLLANNAELANKQFQRRSE